MSSFLFIVMGFVIDVSPVAVDPYKLAAIVSSAAKQIVHKSTHFNHFHGKTGVFEQVATNLRQPSRARHYILSNLLVRCFEDLWPYFVFGDF
jgi:hypothetical protein